MTAWMSNAMKRKKARAAGVQALADWIAGRVRVPGALATAEGSDEPKGDRIRRLIDERRAEYYNDVVHGRRR